MTDPYAALRAAIDAGPTPGTWEVEKYDSGSAHIIGPDSHHIAAMLFSVHTSREQQDAAYIAAASPDVIRALLAERDELARKVEILANWGKSALAERDALEAAQVPLPPAPPGIGAKEQP